ncbi:MAG: hypothetical protein H3C47_09755 [Candidatus Cloacimonetes bacterium]|nr:hypothetical protein [Candidatus Cloacimonadota bacterium]
MVIIVRHPLKRLMSGYFHILRMGFFPCFEPKSGLPELIESQQFLRAREVILEGSFPARFIREWQKKFPGRVVVIALEAGLSAEGELKKIQKGLGLGPFPQNLPANPGSGGIYNLNRISWLKLQNRFMYDYGPDGERIVVRVMKPWEKYLCKLIRRLDQKIVSRLCPNQDYTKQFLDSPLRDRLIEELEALGQILNGMPKQWEKDNRLLKGELK